MNSVSFLIKNRFLNDDDKLKIKNLGRPTPHLTIRKTSIVKNREAKRCFNGAAYEKFSWMCGCPERNKLFCFSCLLSVGSSGFGGFTSWIHEGVDDLKHMHERAVKHERSSAHLHGLVSLNVLTNLTNLRRQLSSATPQSIRAHNEKVDQNRHIVGRLLTCIKHRGAFKVAIDEQQLENKRTFCGLVDCTSELDSVLLVHMKESPVFNTSLEMIQSELLDSLVEVCREEIRKHIAQAQFIAIQADDVTHPFIPQQLVIILRYLFKGQIFERFWGFVRPDSYTAGGIAAAIMRELDDADVPKDKLIAQSYDGGVVMSQRTRGVQSLIRQKYKNAVYVHCYAHQFNRILENAATFNKQLKIFFGDIHAFGEFFSQPGKRTELLDAIAKEIHPPAVIKWNFKTRTIDTLYQNKALIRECLDMIIDTENDYKTISEANGLLRNLSSVDFNYFLEVTQYIILHVEKFFNEVQHRSVSRLYVQNLLNKFESQIIAIRDKQIDMVQLPAGQNNEGDDFSPMAEVESAEQNIEDRDLNSIDEIQLSIEGTIEDKVSSSDDRVQLSTEMKLESEAQLHTEIKIEDNCSNASDEIPLLTEIETENEEPSSKRIRIDGAASKDKRIIAKEYCNTIMAQIRDRFGSTGHLSAARLFFSDLYSSFKGEFPEVILADTVKCYTFLGKEKLRAELQVIYERDDMRCDDILPLLSFIRRNNLQGGFSETYKLLDIILTTPMQTSESDRYFFTSNKIKRWLGNMVDQKGLSALAMLSVEKQLIQSIPDFDSKVINVFANKDERKIDFQYK